MRSRPTLGRSRPSLPASVGRHQARLIANVGRQRSSHESEARVVRERRGLSCKSFPEANEHTIENLSGSTPSQGWFESDESYRERIAQEANESIVENSTGEAPSQGWFESGDSYKDRIGREANERIVEDTTGSSPSQGFFESDSDYDVRIRREANERTVESGTGSSPKQGWFEGDHDYRSRIAHEAREVRASDRPSSSSEASSTDYSVGSNPGAVSSSPSGSSGGIFLVLSVIVGLVVLGSVFGPSQSARQGSSQSPAQVPRTITGIAVAPQIRPEEVITVAPPPLPPTVANFLASNGLRIPATISKYCESPNFHFSRENHPYFVQGDFDGDGETDYAVDVEVSDRRWDIFVLFGNGNIQKLDGWDFISLNTERGTLQTMDGPVQLEHDSISGIRCESSAVLYVFDAQKNQFGKFFTSD